MRLKKEDKITLIFLTLLVSIPLLILFFILYDPEPERYYFIDMYIEQQKELDEKNK